MITCFSREMPPDGPACSIVLTRRLEPGHRKSIVIISMSHRISRASEISTPCTYGGLMCAALVRRMAEEGICGGVFSHQA